MAMSREPAPYSVKDFSKLIGSKGLSETLLKNHFALYQGYVNNTNKVIETLMAMMKDGKMSTPEYAELKRRFGWEFDGMRLHELYFGNLGGNGVLGSEGSLGKRLSDQYGSYESWEKDFKATGAMRGIGWVILYQDSASRALCNCWINEHDGGHMAGCTPLLVMDVFEHAYMTDYGTKKADYIEAFFRLINWDEVGKRVK
jgi:superoxide dismutase, Fe-Mn family